MPKIAQKKPLEMRTVSAKLTKRADAEPGSITGQPVVIGSRTDLGYFDEVIERGPG